MPLADVVGKVGGVDPAQNGAIGLNVGVNTGFDKITPVLRLTVQPLSTISKSE